MLLPSYGMLYIVQKGLYIIITITFSRSHFSLILCNYKYVLFNLNHLEAKGWENIEDTKGLIRSCKSKSDRQYNGKPHDDKHLSTKHYIEN